MIIGTAAALVALGMVASGSPASAGSLAGLAGSTHSPHLQGIVDAAIRGALLEFASSRLDTSQVAVTLVDASGTTPAWASARGEVPIYPASVVKLFYLVATHDALEHQRLVDSEELERALHDMIVDSSNDATSYIVDVLTGTTSGPELDSLELASWAERRNAVNRLFTAQGYHGINCNKKPWGDGPYGRETQASKAYAPGRNMLTTDATARLLTEIALGRAVNAERSRAMLELLARDPQKPSDDPDDQGRGFSGGALTEGLRLWSKAGWTSRARHDAACIQLPDGRRFVLVTFTEGHAEERSILPAIVRRILEAVSK